MTSKQIEAIGRKARRICDGDYSGYTGYSGRGMHGSESPYAFQSTIDPRSTHGAKLRALGLLVDSLGTVWIYYLPASTCEEVSHV